MRISLSFILTLLLTPPTCLFAGSEQASPNPIGRWSEERARVWYKGQPWLVGCNFIPSTAINQLEMWQKETFDPDTIDRELGWAADIGFNIIRVYLHDMLWQQDPGGFVERIDRFLTIANKRDIKVMFVLLDSCWNPFPKLGPQPKPKPHVHNSGWVQSPHIDLLKHADRHDKLNGYVKSIVSKYGNDDRIIMWDIYNEPGNRNGISYGAREPANKDELALALLKKAFAWVREVDPTQPVTAGVYMGQWHKAGEATPLNQFMLNNSDVITFHCYDRSERIKKFIQVLRQYNRPIICTEYMSRGRAWLLARPKHSIRGIPGPTSI